ncbi:alpha/beta hydrolase [Scytonema sp. UIC 10036]|uniref:alpha/beta hydrolase n=1 Tax=Scytonema sp. UIC 10036 TaxID=2304196 RepID=UPI0012DABC1D|nr:alpha/beta fold hydrolase [Scytonema sp. UIC 10036]MUG98426.1 alpha/beta hydrolase [Scytonema sp. UIC 10036]
MSNYTTVINAIIQRTKAFEDDLPIKNNACRSKFFFHPHPTSKVCLFFHGFTAGPYQFEPIGKALFDAGYNVLVPLQPGHGAAGHWDGNNPPPLPTEVKVYQEFALYWLAVARTLGEQVMIGGLSTGGNLAAWLSLERPQEINKALLFAPYISGTNSLVDLFVEVLPIYIEWLNKDNPGNFGYKGFRVPALRIFLEMGEETLNRVKTQPIAPIFTIVAESDCTIEREELQDLFKNTLQHQPKSWYFSVEKIFDIPHTMMTKSEGNQYQDLLITIAKAYIESDITWSELMAIGHQILQGKTFETAVETLNLTQRVSSDLSVLLAVINKKIIIDA